MLKKVLVSGLIALLILAGCSTQSNSDAKSDSLVVYSPNSEDLIATIIPLFEKETGIKVEVISAGTGELMKRIESEKNSPYADVMFGGTKSVHIENIDLFEEYVSSNDKNLIKEYQNNTGKVTSYVLDGNVLLVNTNLVGDIKIEGYKDLLNPELKGKIAHTDASSSSSAFNHVTNMLLAIGGDYESEEGWKYVEQFVENLDGKIASGSGAVHRSVADGEFVVGLTWEDPAVGYVRSGAAPVKVVHPVEGTTYSASATSIVKGANNLENAKKFVDFLLSKEVQDTIGANLNNRPLHVDSKSADYMTPMSDIKLVFEDLEYVIENKQNIVDKYIDIVTSK
ncbi:extracellular solute-binding protein [Bacillus sp. HMF5848]|uniref:ABC transporter substrate-binding protein n=1 Tax=Bacillus sp. HMF5848 TaxID=2495421 RepID=UPI000F768AFF|nr:ABC transporter substrate-binding protein [Bacillus sp. HMF5848]RSK28798.1 extracellular solute-binding protein [Bacillus sp. HMF5848]